jgi:polyferredoxin
MSGSLLIPEVTMTKKRSKRYRKHSSWRTLFELLFFALFVFMTITGRIQLWFAVFALFGLAASLFFGRIYCHAVCPMGTLMRFETWVFNRLGIRRLKTPSFMKHRLFRFFMLAVFILLMVGVKRAGINVPLLPAMLGVSLAVSLIFEEYLWHRTICPFGTLLSLSSAAAKKGFTINESVCIDCGLCEKSCPVEAISHEQDVRHIDERECIGCLACMRVCPVDAVSYS